jgi:hypothetical protein
MEGSVFLVMLGAFMVLIMLAGIFHLKTVLSIHLVKPRTDYSYNYYVGSDGKGEESGLKVELN